MITGWLESGAMGEARRDVVRIIRKFKNTSVNLKIHFGLS